MKHLFSLIILIHAFTAIGSELVELPGKPLCSSVYVRLSPKPIPCIPDGFDPSVFDIPSLKLNLEDLQKIFDGAESSGGHIIGPMNTPQRRRPITPFPFSLNCEAKMLLDGKKKVSFLSTQNFQLSSINYIQFLNPAQWTHSLIEGADIHTDNRMYVDAAPAVALEPFKVELSYNTFYDSFQLSLCEDKSDLETEDLTCAQTEASVREKILSVSFQTRFKGDGKVIHKTVLLRCEKP